MRIASERRRSREDTSEDEDVPHDRGLQVKDGQSARTWGESAQGSTRTLMTPFPEDETVSRARNYLNGVYEDNESEYRYSIDAIHQERKCRRIVRYEEDTDDDSSVSSLSV